MIWIVRILGTLLVITLIFNIVAYSVGSYKGKHVKLLFGLFEDNIPKDHPDTVFKTVIRRDTIYRDKTAGKRINNKIGTVGTMNQY